MSIHQIFGLIAGAISLCAYGLYIYQIWRGNTRPSRSSWWILTVVWGVLLASSLSLGSEGVGSNWTAYVERGIQVVYVAGSLVIAISTIWRGSSQPWGRLDWLCAASAGLALILYFVFENFALSLAMSLLADIFGIIPTVQNARKYPQHEDFNAWALESFASVLALFAITTWAFTLDSASEMLPVFYLVIINISITYLIWSGRRKLKSI